jgi:hypothetical protein
MSCTAIAKWTCAIRFFSVFCGTLNIGPKSADSCTSGKVVGRHRLQREAALAAGESELGLRRRQRHRLVRRHRAQDVDQLSRPDRGREVARIAAELGARPHLDLEVAGRELDRSAGLANEHVGEDRQRVPTLDDSRDGLQRAQEFFLCCFQDNHVNLLNWS